MEFESLIWLLEQRQKIRTDSLKLTDYLLKKDCKLFAVTNFKIQRISSDNYKIKPTIYINNCLEFVYYNPIFYTILGDKNYPNPIDISKLISKEAKSLLFKSKCSVKKGYYDAINSYTINNTYISYNSKIINLIKDEFSTLQKFDSLMLYNVYLAEWIGFNENCILVPLTVKSEEFNSLIKNYAVNLKLPDEFSKGQKKIISEKILQQYSLTNNNGFRVQL